MFNTETGVCSVKLCKNLIKQKTSKHKSTTGKYTALHPAIKKKKKGLLWCPGWKWSSDSIITQEVVAAEQEINPLAVLHFF